MNVTVNNKFLYSVKKLIKDYAMNFGSLCFYFILFVFYEIILRTRTSEVFWDSGILHTVFLALLYAVTLYALISLIPNKIANITEIVILTVIAVIYISQFLHYSIFATFFTWINILHSSEVITNFGNIIWGLIKANTIYMFLYFVPLLLYLVLMPRLYFQKSKIKKNALIALVSQIIVLMVLVPCIINSTSAYALGLVGDGTYNSSANGIGIMASMHIDLLKSFIRPSADSLGLDSVFDIDYSESFPVLSDVVTDETPEEIITNEDPDTLSESENAEYNVVEPEPEPEPKVYGYNIMDIDFNAFAQQEKDKNIKKLHEYFASATSTRQNSYTGMFKDYNFIFITAEAFSYFAVDKELTPTLYKMVHEGFTFTDFYDPFTTSSIDGEFVSCTGLMPATSLSFFKSSENYMPFVMGNQLKSLGYKTVAYHNYKYDYYKRHLSHPNMGYEYKAVGNGLELKKPKVWPQSDLDMMEVTIDEYIDSQPFHAYYMTVSGHMNYTFSANTQSSKNKQKVAHLPYSEEARAYLACQIELDLALEYLLSRLEEAGIAEKTLIVISPDHYPYGLPLENTEELVGHTIETNFELWKGCLIIYSKGMTPQIVDKPCSDLDIIPTVSNLLGLEYDSRLLMGQDIFSDSPPLVVFANKSFITDIGRYNSVTKEFIPNEITDTDFTNYRKQISILIESKFTASRMIIQEDYYRIIFGN